MILKRDFLCEDYSMKLARSAYAIQKREANISLPHTSGEEQRMRESPFVGPREDLLREGTEEQETTETKGRIPQKAPLDSQMQKMTVANGFPAPKAKFPAVEHCSAAFPLHPATSGHSAEHHDRHREGGVAAPSLSPLGRRCHHPALFNCAEPALPPPPLCVLFPYLVLFLAGTENQMKISVYVVYYKEEKKLFNIIQEGMAIQQILIKTDQNRKGEGSKLTTGLMANAFESLASSLEEKCDEPLISALPHSSFSSSSSMTSSYVPGYAKLNKRGGAGGWSPSDSDHYQWLQVDFGSRKQISAIATQGRYSSSDWVTQYRMLYSDTGRNWKPYHQDGNIWIFQALKIDQNQACDSEERWSLKVIKMEKTKGMGSKKAPVCPRRSVKFGREGKKPARHEDQEDAPECKSSKQKQKLPVVPAGPEELGSSYLLLGRWFQRRTQKQSKGCGKEAMAKSNGINFQFRLAGKDQMMYYKEKRMKNPTSIFVYLKEKKAHLAFPNTNISNAFLCEAFPGNTNSDSVVRHDLQHPVIARYIDK
ncbi:Contactin-associated protein-like 2, partial [Lamprotornis superbus]